MRDLLPKIESLSWHYAVPVAVMFALFVMILYWVCRKGAQQGFEEASRLPLRDDA